MNDSFKSQRSLKVGDKSYQYFSLKAAQEAGLKNIDQLPFSLKVLLENLLRHEDGNTVDADDIQAFSRWLETRDSEREIAYYPTRVLMQDFTGVPAVVDLASMRNAMVNLKGDAQKINPLCPVDLVIDHSVQVDDWKDKNAYAENVETEMQRNHERYAFLRWGQQAFKNFRVVPPGTGICHQVNLEYLAKTIWSETKEGENWAYPDTLVGTDSHTTMINGLGVLGWGVGGIEAEAAMLGQAISMLIPQVVGFKLSGKLTEGVTATDLVLTVTQMLRKHGVVGKFVEFFGPGLKDLTLADRATIANMAPEYGATCGLFPIDQETLNYMELTSRDAETIALTKAYALAQGMWHDENSPEPVFSSVLELDLSRVEPCLAGPKRPQDRVSLKDVPKASAGFIQETHADKPTPNTTNLSDGSVVIAAITSCTNTSNPAVMLGAGLLAKKAVEMGLTIKPWVKASLAPGSKVVTGYLDKAGLTPYLEKLGFYLVGYGCTTCIGNSGPLDDSIAQTVTEQDLTVSAVLSGNRNFEGRIHPQVKANWLASPPLVVAYALAGSTLVNLTTDPIATTAEGKAVYLKDLWPSSAEIQQARLALSSQLFRDDYADVFSGTQEWQDMPVKKSDTYDWNTNSTYIQYPPFFTDMQPSAGKVTNLHSARILAIFGDSITTDHISPAGAIKANSPAGLYLKSKGVEAKDFNSYGARRGNHEVMMRGTFANIRIRNEMIPGVEGGFTRYQLDKQEILPIYDAAMLYQQANTPLVIIAGKEYGTGSSRDWAAKGTILLGVKAVIAESFERIHRSNLIGMGVLPLVFQEGQTRQDLNLDGSEIIDLLGLENGVVPGMAVTMRIQHPDNSTQEVPLILRIDTQIEAEYYQNGGILHYVLRKMLG